MGAKSAEEARGRRGRPRSESLEIVVYRRRRADSREMVVYDPHYSKRLHTLLHGHCALTLLERPPALLADTVPLTVSYMDSATLLASAKVCARWSRLCGKDVYWRNIVKEEYALDSDQVDPPPTPVKKLWLHLRRAFRALLVESAAPSGAAPLPALAAPIRVR